MTDYTNPEYELRWPKELFVREARGTLGWDSVVILLEDAFVNGKELTRDPSEISPTLLQDLSANIDVLQQASQLRPYWSQRVSGRATLALSISEVAASLVDVVDDFDQRGYFERVFGADCVDNPRPGTDPALELKRRLGRNDLWPLRSSVAAWDQDTMFDLIEVFHDLAARPTDGNYHSFAGCGWDYNNYSSSSGRAVYRWVINRLLDASNIEYRLAEEGEDIGRLVTVTDDAREDLMAKMLQRADPGQGRVEHAIALFRFRGATRDDKRSAVRALIDILESRRQLLDEKLLKKDEAALFQIANKFDVRHHRADQRPDYDDAYLDWLFWWYLATIELSDRLIAGQEYPST